MCLSHQAYVRHPEVASAKANRDFVMKQMSEAVNVISGATQATGTSGPHPLETPGALASALDDFDVSLAQFVYVIDFFSGSVKTKTSHFEYRLFIGI